MPRRATWARYLGAIALLGVGLDHLEQFSVDHYSAIPTIGTLFALNFASAALLALGLLAPARRLPRRAVPVLACGGIGVAAGSLAGLAASESIGLFGFMESGYRGAIVLSIALEVATIVLLSVAVALGRPARDHHGPADAPADLTPAVAVDADAEHRIDELQDRLRALVLERGLLEIEEAGGLELRTNHQEITRTRERLWRALESRDTVPAERSGAGIEPTHRRAAPADRF
jgi:hypothetical protein